MNTPAQELAAWRIMIAPRVVQYLEKLYAEAKESRDGEAMDLLHEAKCCVKERAAAATARATP